jgi:O-antigen/teichoic acid export membrane protein
LNNVPVSITSKIKNLLGERDSYKRKTIKASLIVVGGDALMLLMRLGGNLLITRMLYPEAMGLMVVVTMVMIGLHLLSDAGVINAVVLFSKERGPEFLDTAWTMLVIRGFLVFLLCQFVAVPIAHFYDNEQLVTLIMVAGLGAVASGFASPQIMLCQRDIRMEMLTTLEVSSNFLGLIITLSWLHFYPTIWALVGHSVLIQILRSGLSFVLLDKHRPRFVYDKVSVSEIFNFGKWIVISSGVTFLAMQGDRIIVAKWLSIADVGVYGIAAGLYLVLETALGALNGKVLFPVFAEIKKSGKEAFIEKHRKAKILMLGFSAPIVLIFLLLGSFLVELLYDERYHGAGWMLQVLAIGGIFSVLSQSIGPVLLSHGDSKGHMLLQLLRVVLLASFMYVGGSVAGSQGLILGVALSHIFYYPALFLKVQKYGINSIRLDLFYFSIIAVVIGLAWIIMGPLIAISITI